jgi:N-acetyl-beta-hexosaminidase
MRHYYAKDGDLYVKGFISFDQEKEKFQLKLISKLFEENKENVMEAFSLGDLTDKIDTSNPNNPPPDAETGEYIGGLKNIGYSTPLYGWNNDFFVNNLVYGYDPIPSQLNPEEARYILGAQGNVWTEYMPSFEQVTYMALPRMAALAEVLWTPLGQKDYPDFLQRLRLHSRQLDALGYRYAPHFQKTD